MRRTCQVRSLTFSDVGTIVVAMTTLGLTIGSTTIGWALLDESKIVAQGVRAFPAGTIGDIESGRDVSRNQQRQDARQHRVQLRRRAGRLKRLFRLLQGAGWLPEGVDRHTILEGLKMSPYALRTKALDEKLEPHELGRAIYHLAHRRGFKSNRRREPSEGTKAKELGVVKQAIADLEAAILASGARTLGEYLSTQPSQRRRWTGRAMYVTELDVILASQARFQTVPLGLRSEITKVVFDQKPLKSQKGRVGRCSLEQHFRRRMALAHPCAQEFRILQQVNDLRAVDDLGADTVEITQTMRQKLTDHLQANGDATFAEVRKVLGLPKTVRFNFERADKKTLVGDRTRQGLGGVYPDGLVEDILSIAEDAGLQKRLVEHWKANPELAFAKLEHGYLSISHRAATKLLPLMRTGVSYAAAVKEVYGAGYVPKSSDQLPLVADAYPYLANPLVSRAMSELRRLIHAIIKQYGKPERIRIELHRHLQMGPKSRQAASRRMWARYKMKRAVAERLLKENKTIDPSPWQIDRVLLAEECQWECPISFKKMSFRSVTRPEGESDFLVAHIIPFGMSLDDGWNNKILVHASVLEKRSTSLLSEVFPDKEGKISAHFLAFQDSPKKSDKNGKKGGKKQAIRRTIGEEKLRRFKLTREQAIKEYGDTYVDRYVESSSYAARTAAEYLSRLDVRVETIRGRASGYIREAVGLSRLRRETQGDYRYRVLDAISVALTSPRTVRALCTAAKVGDRHDRRRFAAFPMPWDGFVEEATRAMYATTVSHRVKNRVRGPLHEQTNNGYPKTDVKGNYQLVRKSLASITKSDVKLIAGSQIRDVVLKALGNNEPKKWFADPQNLPIFHGRQVRRVRVVRREGVFLVGDRYVTNEKNHHAVVRDGKRGWEKDVVSLYDAQQRLRKGEPIYQSGIMTIAPGEIFSIEGDDGREELICIRSVPGGGEPRIHYVKIHDCRTLEEIDKELGRKSVEQLRKRGIQKVTVDVIGNVRRPRVIPVVRSA